MRNAEIVRILAYSLTRRGMIAASVLHVYPIQPPRALLLSFSCLLKHSKVRCTRVRMAMEIRLSSP